MSRDVDRYSKAVYWLKVVLPIVGLGILSTLFLVARDAHLGQRDMPPEVLAPDGGSETVTSPRYSGVTGDGSNVTITADTAWPKTDGSGWFEGTGLGARFDLPNGDSTDIKAESGTLMSTQDLLALRGNVVVTTASGWTMETETLDAQLDWTRLVSPTHVRITEGPIGTLDAGDMLITRDTGTDGNYLIEFDGGVHLVYLP